MSNKFCLIVFFIFLESSETYADPSLSKIGSKFNFSSKYFVEKSKKIMLNEKTRKLLLHKLQNIARYFGTKKLNLASFEVSISRNDPKRANERDEMNEVKFLIANF